MEKSFSEFIKLATEEYLKQVKDYTLLYNLTKRCRQMRFYHFGYFCGKLLEPLNNYQYLDELAICAYYIGEYQESYNLCKQILSICPENEKERIIRNQSFNLKKLEEK